MEISRRIVIRVVVVCRARKSYCSAPKNTGRWFENSSDLSPTRSTVPALVVRFELSKTGTEYARRTTENVKRYTVSETQYTLEVLFRRFTIEKSHSTKTEFSRTWSTIPGPYENDAFVLIRFFEKQFVSLKIDRRSRSSRISS